MSILILDEDEESIQFDLKLIPDLDEIKNRRRISTGLIGNKRTETGFNDPVEYSRFISNQLRRIFISDIPNWAIDNIRILINTSPLSDELLIHRVSFIPLDTGVVEVIANLDSELEIELDSSGPGPILGSSLVLDNHGERIPVIGSEVLIGYLRSEQQVKFSASIKPGTMKDHSKWAATSVVEYQEIQPNLFRYRLETIGQLNPRQILWLGLQILEEKWNIRIDLTIKERSTK